MSQPFTLRSFTPADGPAFAELLLAAPDTGRITLTLHYLGDPYESMRVRQGDDFLGVVAEAPGHEGLVGAGLVRFGRMQLEGRLYPYAYLNTLIVHPDFRRQGIATALVNWRVQAARERLGEDAVIWAHIQQGNIGSVRTVTKYLPQMIPDRQLGIPMTARSKPLKSKTDWQVRDASAADLPAIARRLNDFYRDYNFYEPQTSDSLSQWITSTIRGESYRRYLVVSDGAGAMLAGAGVEESYRLSELHVSDLSLGLRLANAFLHLVPADGVSRSIAITKYWHGDGQREALRYLVEHIRWAWRDRANMVLVSCDANDPVRPIFPTRPWTPIHVSAVVADAPVAISPERLLMG